MWVELLLFLCILSLLDIETKVKDDTLCSVIWGCLVGMEVNIILVFFYLTKLF